MTTDARRKEMNGMELNSLPKIEYLDTYWTDYGKYKMAKMLQ
jgi:hypothetical protein